MAQVVFGKRTVGNEQLGVATKSDRLAPVTLIEVTLSDCPPVLVRGTILELLDWPTVMAPKSSEVGKIPAGGPLPCWAGGPRTAGGSFRKARPTGEAGAVGMKAAEEAVE